MNTDALQRHFDDCQLPVQFLDIGERRRPRFAPNMQPSEAFFFVDVANRARPNEFFQLYRHDDAELTLRDKRPKTQHLVLQLRFQAVQNPAPQVRHYLLGHDERQLFVVAPEASQTVAAALDSLKPTQVLWAERRGRKVVRQGDWFFIHVPPVFGPTPNAIHYEGERIGLRFISTGGNAHIADEQYLSLTPRYQTDTAGNRRQVGHIVSVWVRGAIRHAEHSTIKLQEWHLAVQNRPMQFMNPTIGYRD